MILGMHRTKEQQHDHAIFRAALNASGDAIVMTKASGEILYVNKAWERLNGYTLREVVGKDPHILQSGKTPKTVFRDMWRALQKGKIFTTEEIVNRRKDGTEYCERISISPVFIGKTVVYFIGLIQDITLRKQMEELQDMFITTASHQLKTPLSIIRWYVEVLSERVVGERSIEETSAIKTIQKAVDRGIGLVDNLLALSQHARGRLRLQMQRTNLCVLAKQVADEFLETPLGRNVAVVIELPHQPIVASVDANFLREALRNIVNNAVSYTEKGCVRICVGKQKSMHYIDVCDTGPGVPKIVQERILNSAKLHSSPFTMDSAHVGLYLACTFLRMQGGDVQLLQSSRKGSTFRILLPRKVSATK